MSNLKKLASGVGWGTISVITVTCFQLVFMAVMARLLEPTHFGLVAIANVSLRFFSYFAQMGIAPALIQKPTLEDADVRAALALSLAISGFFTLLAVGSAGLIEGLFGTAGLGLVMRVLAINFLVVGFSSVSLGLMRRRGAFKELAIIEIVSYVCGYGFVGLSAGYLGAGVWALVAAFMTQTIITAVLSYSVIRFPIRLNHTKVQRIHFLSYGGRYSITGFIEFLTSNIDALIIGKLMGATTSGYYSRALLLANIPVQQPANVLTRVLFPIMSKMGNENTKQSISLQLSVLLVGSYAFSVGAGIYIAAPEIVKVLLGNKWDEAIPILQVLAWSVGPIYVSHVASVALDSMNLLKSKLRIQLVTFIVMIVLISFAAASHSAPTIAMAIVVTEWFRVFIMGLVLVGFLKIPIIDVLKILISVVINATTTGLSVLYFSKIVSGSLPIISHLLIDIISGAFGLLLGLLLTRIIVSRHPAIIFMGNRLPRFANILHG